LFAAFETIIKRERFSDFAFTTAFKSWEETKGFPMIHISLDDDNKQFTISQERYYAASETKLESDNRRWFIPLNLASASDPNFENTKFTHYFENDQGPTKNFSYPDGFDSAKWFVFNKQQLGFYRVNYDFNNWHELIRILNSDNFKQIHVLNRAQLIDDSLNLAADGYLSYEVAFGILSYLSRETDYIPWRAAVTSLEKLDYLLTGRPVHESFRTFVKQLARRVHVTFGFEERSGDSLMDKFTRELAIDWSCRMQDMNCLTTTYSHLQMVVEENQEIPDSLEIAVICNGLKGVGKQFEFTETWKRMQASTDQAKRLRMIDGLLCSEDSKALMDLLETVITNTAEANYRTHERTRIFNNILSRSSVGVAVMTEFISEFYAETVAM
jgi:aminopeptidase N